VLRYAKPRSVEEALALLAEDSWRILAGGTDFYPALGSKPLRENVLDINGLAELRNIAETDAHFVIGARTTWTDIIRHRLPPAFEALKLAAREVGAVQIQNTGTVAGNLCNASPAADGVPALMILDAEVELSSAEAIRYLSLSELILGNRRTARKPGELVTAIRIPKGSAAGASSFFKLGARRYLVISIAMAAARIGLDGDGTVKEAAVAIGACSAVAMRLSSLEAALVRRPADASLGEAFDPAHFAALSPINDVRGSADYRRDAAREIARRAVMAAVEANDAAKVSKRAIAA
jgi:CO/xanthine dehydrogenase FAD-binding subunit